MSGSGAPGGSHGGHGGGHGGGAPPDLPRIDVREKGGKGEDGEQRTSDRRLFVQLLGFEVTEGDPGPAMRALSEQMASRKVGSVVYADVNHPRGFALATWSADPATFVRDVRPGVLALPGPVRQRPELTMLGRSYSQGHEEDLEFWLVKRPISVALNAAWPWAIWYPLRRSGAFAKLEPREQASILREHGIIGRAYGQDDLAHDIRLACHGLDQNDNEFVIGLVGKDLHPLSHVVQSMRKTRQTAEFIQQMGPFFVGHAAHRTGEG